MRTPADRTDSTTAGGKRRRSAAAFAILILTAAAATSPAAAAEDGENFFHWLGDFLGRPGYQQPEDADGSAARPVEPAKPAPGPAPGDTAAPAADEHDGPARALDRPLTVGLGLGLDAAAPYDGRPPLEAEGPPCLTKNRDTTLFCIQPIDWPDAMGPKLWVSSHMYQGNQAVVRYDGGRATSIHALIPTTAYEETVGWYTQRLGPPSNVWERHIDFLGGERRANPTAVWRGTEATSGDASILEVRRFDDSRGGFPDSHRGAILLRRVGAEPIFPQLSSVELMAMRVTEGPRPETATASEPPEAEPADVVRPLASAEQPKPSPAASNRPASAPPEFTGANPFDPHTRIGNPVAPDGVEEPQALLPAPPAASNPPAEKTQPDPLGDLARFFTASNKNLAAKEEEAPAEAGPAEETLVNAGAEPAPAEVPGEEAEAPHGHGFFTRLAHTFAQPEAAGKAVPARPQPAVSARNLRALRDVPLALGDELVLGQPLPAQASAGCTGTECRIYPHWSVPIAVVFEGDPATGTAAVALQDGKVISARQQFPERAFQRLLDHLRHRYGDPTASVTAAGSDSTAMVLRAAWRSVSSRDGTVTTLEIRRPEATRAVNGHARLGDIRLYREETGHEESVAEQAGARPAP